LHLEYLDCVYRSGPDGEWLYTGEEALWAELHLADPVAHDGARSLANRLAGILPTEEEMTICAPLSAGHHVDHQIVHAAARRLWEMGYPVTFYEEYPYAEQPGEPEAALAAIGGLEWAVELLPVAVADIAAKVFALGYYRSQMPVLFGSAEAMPNRLWSFAASRSREAGLAERIWHPSRVAGGEGIP
jgi:LmbE family N-acetylglucosaminyl deacetylase